MNGWGSLAPPGRAQSSLSCPHISNLWFPFPDPTQTFRPSSHPRHCYTRTRAHTSFGNNLDLHCPVLSPRHWIPSEHSSSPHLAAHLLGQTPTSVLKSLEKENRLSAQTPPFLGSAGASCWPNGARGRPWPWLPAGPMSGLGMEREQLLRKMGKDGEAWGD